LQSKKVRRSAHNEIIEAVCAEGKGRKGEIYFAADRAGQKDLCDQVEPFYWYNEGMDKVFGLRLVWIVIMLCAIGLGVYAWIASRRTVVLVEWSTASELDTAGYNVYRSENPENDFVKINAQVIPGSNDPWVGSDYSFTDEAVVPGTTYYYLLDDVGMDGTTSRHGPVEITAKAGGKMEMALAAALVLIACGGLWITTKRGGEKVS